MPRCQQCDSESATLEAGLCPKCKAGNEQTLVLNQSSSDDSSDSSPGQTNIAGTKVGDYEIIEEIARGGMGVIYKAKHSTLNRVAALKMILSGQFSSKEEMQRFRVEAEAAARLDHSGIIPVYEIGESDGRAFFAMKYVEGGSLTEKIQEMRTNLPNAMKFLVKVSQAVHHAHQRGILHRDLKPANILVEDNDQPRITDLGLAKITNNNSEITNTGAVLGTPSYMSPEQAMGLSSVTTAVDIYALGAIMYELLTGVPPHRGETALDTILQIREGVIESPSKKNPSLDYELELICLKCLERNPEQRYDSVLSFVSDLEAWINHKPISIRSPSWRDRTSLWFQRNRKIAYLAFAVLMGILVTIPFALNFIAGQNFVRVYDYFPEESRPWLFSFGQVPNQVNFIGGMFLVLFLWPILGFLNAYIARPTSYIKALGAGGLTSCVLIVIFTVLLGWMPLMRLTHDDSREKLLTQALWPKQGQDADFTRELANKMYPGLDKIPVKQRADVIAFRLHSDRLGAAPQAIAIIIFVEFCLMIPVIYGTALAYSLLKRGNNNWIALFRYIVAWWLIATIFLTVVLIINNTTSLQDYPKSAIAQQLSICVVAALMFWMIVRHWKRDFPTESLSSS